MPASAITTLALGLITQVGLPGPSEMPNYPALRDANNQYGFEGRFEQRYPFDTQQNWVHGYFQEIPAYGGHVLYRPYNYKDVLSQSQTAAGWGMSPTMPYSQQFWHRYHDQATMLKLSRSTGAPPQPVQPASGILPTGAWAQPGPITTQPSWTGAPNASPAAASSWAFPTMPAFSAPVQTTPVPASPWFAPALPQAAGPMLPPPQ